MSDAYLGEIRPFPYSYAPKGWAICDGSLLSISEYPQLFALLGSVYGGDGRTSFGLPNLTDRVAVGDGHGAGLTPRRPGERGGIDALPLTETTLASHRHTLRGTSTTGSSREPHGAMFANIRRNVYRRAPGGTGTMLPETLSPTGETQTQPHENRQPSLELIYCIAVEGIYPPEQAAGTTTEVGAVE
ncbi:phage tail protein [Candidatus Bipolaricaulota bacterium]